VVETRKLAAAALLSCFEAKRRVADTGPAWRVRMASEGVAKAATEAAAFKAHAAYSAATARSILLPEEADASAAAEAAACTSAAAPEADDMPAAMACRFTTYFSATPCALHLEVLDGMRVDLVPEVSRAAASRFGDADAAPLVGSAASRSGDAAAALLGGAPALVFGGATASRSGGQAATRRGGVAASHCSSAAAPHLDGAASSPFGGAATSPLGGAASSHFGGAAATPVGCAGASCSGGETAGPLGVVAATCFSSEADVKSLSRRLVMVEVASLTADCGEERRGEQEVEYGW